MSLSEETTKVFLPKIWTEDFDLLLLEELQKRRVDINKYISSKIYDDIVEESFPTHTMVQCRVRLSKIKCIYRSYQNGGKVTNQITQKVYDKLQEMMLPTNTKSPYKVVSLLPRPEIAKTERTKSKRIWNSELDERLLDGIIRLEAYSPLGLRKAALAEIVENSLPNFTIEQCKERWKNMHKIYKNKPESRSLSSAVLEKLKYFESLKSKVVEKVQKPEKQQKSPKFVRIWDEEAELKLLNALAELHSDFKRRVRTSVYREIAEKVFSGKMTTQQCKQHGSKLRKGYFKRKASGKCCGIWFTRKVYAKLCELYDDKSNPRVVPEPEICRCCGQIDNNLIDLDKEAATLEWFLAFTGLAAGQLVRPYTKICQMCGEKLAQAQKFRELCLMGDQIIHTELANKPPVEVPIDEGLFLEDIVYEPSVEKPPLCCTVCGDMVPRADYQKHRREHLIQENKQNKTCKICGITYKNSLKSHMQFHIDGKIHACPKCPKKFNCIGTLKTHMNGHMYSRKGNPCSICGKVYESSSGLKFHMNHHNGIKPCICRYCGLRFARMQGLNNHINSRHENVRFQCSFCDMKYVQSGKLKMHVLLQHEDAILRCNLCSLESTTLKSFKYHLKNRHRAAFNQSIHVILSSGEKLIRRRKLDKTLIQTTKIDMDAGEPGIIEEMSMAEEQIELEELPFGE